MDIFSIYDIIQKMRLSNIRRTAGKNVFYFSCVNENAGSPFVS